MHVVGGAVRDALLGRVPRELDLVVEGDAVAVARRAAERVGGTLTVHERFGTATVRTGEFAFDLATARRERYPRPGALPEVELGATIAEDLARRDFSVNAMAVSLQRRRPHRLAGSARGPRPRRAARAPRPLVRRRPDADAAARPLRRAARVRARPAHGRAGRPGTVERPSAVSARATSCGCCCASRSRRCAASTAWGGSCWASASRSPGWPSASAPACSRLPPAARRSRPRSSRARLDELGVHPSGARGRRWPPRPASTGSAARSTSATPSCGGDCAASAPRPCSCSPPPASAARSAGSTTSATAGCRSRATTWSRRA